MIQKISVNYNNAKTPVNTAQTPIQNPNTTPPYEKPAFEQTQLSGAYLDKYYVSFHGKQPNKTENKMSVIESNLTPYGEEILEDAKNLAAQYKHTEVTQTHVIDASLKKILQYINDLDSEKRIYGDESSFALHGVLEEEISPRLFKDKEQRSQIKPVIEEQIKILNKKLENTPPGEPSTPQQKRSPMYYPKLNLSKDFLNDIYSLYQQENSEDMDGDGLVNDYMLFESALYPNNDKIKDEVTIPLRTAIKDEMMVDKKPLSERIHLKFYDDKAKNIWKNLNVGTNMVVLHDKKANPNFLTNSFLYTLAENENGFGRLNKNNTEVIILKPGFDFDYLKLKMHKLAKDNSKNFVFVLDIVDPDTTMSDTLSLGESNISIFKEAPKNVKFVMLANKDAYYSNSNSDECAKLFADYGEISMPIINMAEAKKMFRDEPKLVSKIKKHFTPNAIQKCVEAANQLEGNYPAKAQKIMDLISAYYVDKDRDITLADVNNYIKEAKEVFKTNENETSVKMVFDTGVKLKDLVGVPSTKKEAESIVNRIKDRTIGTKGFVIYSQDGSVGGGRKYTAQAIAGQAKIPYFEINAVDFGTKDVDLFGGGNLSPEASMKKLFGLAKAQAETNPSKSAMLFIENFEYFSVGDQVSEYHEKAMSQLLREMESAQKQGLNVVVMGSTSDPRFIGESTSKSFKFIDLVEVESPGRNEDARKEIITYYAKKKGLKLAGETPEAKQEIINSIASTTNFFSFIEILTLLDKAKNVAKERSHKVIDKSDVTEAYLQLTTGRPAMLKIPEYTKNIVTSHECGHALTMTVMLDLAKKQNNPWHMGDRVNFITLDPRGTFGGCVCPKETENDQWSFEKVFSDIVCDFGGNSSEKRFYNMDGSWGISSDMQMATHFSTLAVSLMGQGKHFGKKSLDGMQFMSERDKNLMNKDIDVILKNAQATSDLIVDVYSDFVTEFTKKYSSKVGTGECLIQGEVFEQELADWKKRQTPEKLAELDLADEVILKIIQACKDGKAVKRASN